MEKCTNHPECLQEKTIRSQFDGDYDYVLACVVTFVIRKELL